MPHNGDSGSPLVCSHGNKLVARGLLTASNFTLSRFTDIPFHLEWIFEVINKTEKAAVYESGLAHYINESTGNEADSKLMEDHLQYLYAGLSNTLRLDMRNNIANTPIMDYGVLKTVEKILNIRRGFCLEEIIGYSSVANLTGCVILCYNENYHGGCNYSPLNNRCYFAKVKQSPSVVIDTEMSIFVSFKNAQVKLQPEHSSSSLPNQMYQPPENRATKWFQHYEVSIHGTKWTDFHCLAMLQSSAESYDRICVSSNCLQQL
uniref:Uncharacterized protein n=1 Tax=Romanomermis culicivorax TaxID=13658 RepID=A0A915JXH4_ROMCU